ncbi:ABC transporter substrate-binding protein [Tengunoibacter tsumagoiensis]|uniref:Leucine-binding protein domain-containing protein n=1 Tax=Tengunoibacter tsumagoiensis TaxID=2014871 RepID=A0A402A628_9CHLR|nr:ABC transporter substrate-binding protein [Tengunoibacter tsumagoiensis]GCE14580.1 hypothetical protein KTT_44390 [Tengunoibacter tsumagoiensis]
MSRRHIRLTINYEGRSAPQQSDKPESYLYLFKETYEVRDGRDGKSHDPWPPEEFAREQFSDREGDERERGTRLFKYLFADNMKYYYDYAINELKRAKRDQQEVRCLFNLKNLPPELQRLPWHLLYDKDYLNATGEKGAFLCSEPFLQVKVNGRRQKKNPQRNDRFMNSAVWRFSSSLPGRVLSVIIVIVLLASFWYFNPLLSFIGYQTPSPAPTTFTNFCRTHAATNFVDPVPLPPPVLSIGAEPPPATNHSLMVGLSEGTFIYDTERVGESAEVSGKLSAAQDASAGRYQLASTEFQNLSDPHALAFAGSNDAEARIYAEDQSIFAQREPYITIIVGVTFDQSDQGSSRDTLQGAFLAQYSCNHVKEVKTHVVLMIANEGVSGNDYASSENEDRIRSMIQQQTANDRTIVGIVGWNVSSVTTKVVKELNMPADVCKISLPMISPSASSDSLNNMCGFFRITGSDREQATLAADYIQGKFPHHVVIFYDPKDPYSQDLDSTFNTHMTGQNPQPLIEAETYTVGDSDSIKQAFADEIKKATTQPPLDTIYFAGYPADLSIMLPQIATSPTITTVIGPDAFATFSDYRANATDFNKVYYTTFASQGEWTRNHLTEGTAFLKNYMDTFGRPPVGGIQAIDEDPILSYDAMQVLLFACSKTPSDLSATKVVNAIKQITVVAPFQGLSGRIAFNDTNFTSNPVYKSILIEHFKDGVPQNDDPEKCFLANDPDQDCATFNPALDQ